MHPSEKFDSCEAFLPVPVASRDVQNDEFGTDGKVSMTRVYVEAWPLESYYTSTKELFNRNNSLETYVGT